MLLVYEEQTRMLRRCFYDVQNEVGLGRQEQAYQRGCELWLRENGVPFRSRAAHPIRHRNAVVHTFFPDLVVWDLITVELKAVRRRLEDSEFVQIFDYLKCRKDRLGLLVNMGLDRVQIERVLYDPPKPALVEDWRYWTGQIKGRDRESGIAVRDGLRAIFKTHGTGYGEEVSQKLIMCELHNRGLAFACAPVSKAHFRGVEVDESPLECLVIDERMVLTLSALFDDNKVNVSRGKSYLRALHLEWGVAANYGKKEVQITGLRVSR